MGAPNLLLALGAIQLVTSLCAPFPRRPNPALFPPEFSIRCLDSGPTVRKFLTMGMTRWVVYRRLVSNVHVFQGD